MPNEPSSASTPRLADSRTPKPSPDSCCVRKRLPPRGSRGWRSGAKTAEGSAGRQPRHRRGDVTASEILNNIEAMRWGVDTVSAAEAISVEHLLGIHERLLAGTTLDRHAGRFATSRTGSAVSYDLALPRSCPRRLGAPDCSRICARSAAATHCPPWLRPLSRTPSSKRSTRSSTATDGPGAHSSTWCCERRGLARWWCLPHRLRWRPGPTHIDGLTATRYRDAHVASRDGRRERLAGPVRHATRASVADATS